MFTLRFDMRAPAWGARIEDLYAAAIDMAAWSEALEADPDPFTREEVNQILACVEPRWRGFYRVWFATGLRSNEIVALRWEDIDWNRQMIRVCLGWAARWKVEAEAKTGRRDIDVSGDPGVFETLEAERHRSIAVGRPAVIFVDDAGERLDQEAMHKRIFSPALRRAGIRHRGSYAIRDTFISHALAEGAPINAVAKFCGTSVRMIEKHYWRWIEGCSPGRVPGALWKARTPESTPETIGATEEIPGNLEG